MSERETDFGALEAEVNRLQSELSAALARAEAAESEVLRLREYHDLPKAERAVVVAVAAERERCAIVALADVTPNRPAAGLSEWQRGYAQGREDAALAVRTNPYRPPARSEGTQRTGSRVDGDAPAAIGPSAPADPPEREIPAAPSKQESPWNSEATHRCKVCGALWWEGDVPPVGLSWSLRSQTCGRCCDNGLMGEQIEPLHVYAAQLRAERDSARKECEALAEKCGEKDRLRVVAESERDEARKERDEANAAVKYAQSAIDSYCASENAMRAERDELKARLAAMVATERTRWGNVRVALDDAGLGAYHDCANAVRALRAERDRLAREMRAAIVELEHCRDQDVRTTRERVNAMHDSVQRVIAALTRALEKGQSNG